MFDGETLYQHFIFGKTKNKSEVISKCRINISHY